MIAIILAAGMGKRLRPLTENKPKCLIDLNNKDSILSFMLKKILTFKEIEKIRIVGGYKFDVLKSYIEKNFPNERIEVIKNKSYERENYYSLFTGIRDLQQNDIVIINSDVIAKKDIIDKLINSDDTSLIIDNREDLDEEDMKVVVKDGVIVKIGKQLDPHKSYGEYIGIAKIKKEHIPLLKESLTFMINNSIEDWYERAFQIMIEKGCKFIPVNTDGLPWTEIDTFDDLEHAKRLIDSVLD